MDKKTIVTGANPYMPLWEHVPDGEPRVFTYNGETTGLISVGISLDCPNGTDVAFADLQQKLRTVYGDGDIDDDNTYFKTGENNTAVLLRKNNAPMLIYGITNATELLNASIGAPTANPSDTNGL